MWILRVLIRVLKWMASFIAPLGLVLVTTPPKEMESNVAAWLEYFGVGSWGEGFTATTDAWITAGLILLGIIAVTLWVHPYWRNLLQQAAPKRVEKQLGNFPFPTVRGTVEVHKKSLPKPWRNPVKWLRWKITKSPSHLIKR